MAPLISVIIPVYNAEKYLRECLDSVCGQTLQDIEIICVNDGSVDKSGEILAEYAAKDDRVRIISQPNNGPAAARSTGIGNASGQWLGFVDSDDLIVPDFYEHLLRNAVTYQADISHCGMKYFYPDGREVPHFGTGIKKVQDHDTALFDFLSGDQIEPGMCCKLYKAELFRDTRLDYSVRTNEDLLCNFSLFEKSSAAVYEDFCGYHYRRHDSNASANWRSVESLKTILGVRWEILEKCSGEIRKAAYRLWLSTLVHALNLSCTGSGKEAAVFYKSCREKLSREKNSISCLSAKQRLAARLHLAAPWLARQIYIPYGKYSLYRYEQ